MNKFHFTLRITAILFFLFVFFVPVSAQYFPVGNLDGAGCSVISGWSCDRDNVSQAVTIHFYADKPAGTGQTPIGTTVANVAREAAVGAQCGGNINHGFVFTVPDSLKNNLSHLIYVYAINIGPGSNPLLTGSPKTLQCAPPPTCTNKCSAGTKQCSGNGYQACSDTNGDGCLEWSTVTACAANQTCSGGVCAAVSPTCTNDCLTSGLKQCSGNGYQICGNYDSDSCLEWNTVTVCASGQACSGGSCVAASSCFDECSYSGLAQCSGNGYQICGNYDSDSCLEWSGVTSCSSGQTCSSGICRAACSGEKSKKCDGGDLYWYDSCGKKGDMAQNCGDNTLTANFRCSGNLVQRGVITKACVANACTEIPDWDNYLDCSKTGKICKNAACAGADVVSPAISNLSPKGIIYSSAATLFAVTNETAVCRYGFHDASFDGMTTQLVSLDKLHHSALLSLKNYGNYIYYVRCRDNSGNANSSPSLISFSYSAPSGSLPSDAPAPTADTTPPEISDLAPEGVILTPAIAIVFATDEKSICKYDITDTDFDSMEDAVDGSIGVTSHKKGLVLSNFGTYNYYVRCKDAAGNKNSKSATISFDYVPAESDGVAISSLQPSGMVYQKSVALTLATDKASECRWSVKDQEFDAMAGLFTSSDGQNQQALVDLSDYGSYKYYVRCKDKGGVKASVSSVLSFEYKNPAQDNVPVADMPAEATKNPMACANPAAGKSDNSCDAAMDCVCDPDCESIGQMDPDCDSLKVDSKTAVNNINWVVAASFGAAILIVVLVIIFLKNKTSATNGGGEETD